MNICFLCNRVFDGNATKKHECQKKGLLYFCPHEACFYSSENPHRVKLHNSAVHFKFKRFKCTVRGCNFQAAQKSDLQRHILKHSNDRPHKCHLCHKTFKAKEAYFTHIRTMHCEEYEKMKPFKCDCGIRYKFRPNLYRHMVMCKKGLEKI